MAVKLSYDKITLTAIYIYIYMLSYDKRTLTAIYIYIYIYTHDKLRQFHLLHFKQKQNIADIQESKQKRAKIVDAIIKALFLRYSVVVNAPVLKIKLWSVASANDDMTTHCSRRL